jgi:hypothetical protein
MSCFLLLLCLHSVLGSGSSPVADDWKYDVIHRKRGVPLRGLIVEQTSQHVRIRCVIRRPGSPTVLFPEIVAREEIARLELLGPEDRAVLESRLETLRRERQQLSEQLLALDPTRRNNHRFEEKLDLQSTSWPGDNKTQALSYQSAHFTLIANARPELVQLVAIHLEQVYAAYVRSLPPRTTKAERTTILLTRSLAEYQALARSRGLNLFNPAFYDPVRNQVVCGSDLERLYVELEQIAAHHAQQRLRIKETRAELHRIYRGKVPAELLAPLNDADKRMTLVEQRNAAALKRARERLFQRLYHEAFHAYLGAFVFPGKANALPIWLNEGLAQLFETAIVEAGELRIDHVDPNRRLAMRAALAEGKLLPLTELLTSQPQHFQVARVAEQQVSDRYYLAAWALAFYLTFEQKIINSPALDDYVRALERGTDPLPAFAQLVGQNPVAFEKQFNRYLSRLRADGRTEG